MRTLFPALCALVPPPVLLIRAPPRSGHRGGMQGPARNRPRARTKRGEYSRCPVGIDAPFVELHDCAAGAACAACAAAVPWVRDSSPPHPPDTKIPTRYYCCRALPDSSVAAHTLAHWEIGRVPHCAALLSTATRSRYCARRSSRLAGAPPATLLSLRTAAAVASSRAIPWRRGQRAEQTEQSTVVPCSSQ